MSLKLCAPNINSRSTSGVQRVAKTSDAFAMGQNSLYPLFMAGNSNTFGQQEPVQILDLAPSAFGKRCVPFGPEPRPQSGTLWRDPWGSVAMQVFRAGSVSSDRRRGNFGRRNLRCLKCAVAGGQQDDLCTDPSGLVRRLVLEKAHAAAACARARGVHSDADRARRARAPGEAGNRA